MNGLKGQKDRILIVDDEPQILSSIRDILEDDFEVLTESSGEAALEVLKREPVAVIVCDQRMPGLSGDLFFEQARALSEATRVLITGYTDLNALVRAVNNGQIYAYVAKPWDPLALKFTIEKARDHHELVSTLRHERDLLHALMDNVPDAIHFKNKDLLFTRLNQAQAQLLGVEDPQKAIGKTVLDLLDTEETRLLHAGEEEIVRSGHALIDQVEKIRTREGKVRWISSTKVPLRREDGQVVALIGISRDITEKRQLEEQLRQSQKMEAIGRLAGGVTHDFNNLLTGITGFTQLVLNQVEGGSQLEKDLTEVLQLTDRAAGLTRQLLAFTRQQLMEARILNMNPLIEDLTKMLKRLLGERIQLAFIPASDVGNIRGDAGQIEQILLNVAVNAADAMPEGGRLTIETGNTEFDGGISAMHFGVEPGSYVALTVSDTGCGMSSETQEHIFEPFFTTKEVGKGTGLGLSTVYGIVKQHKGQIWVYSEVGKGTIFKIYFPREDSPVDAVKVKPAGREPMPSGSETILLAEDEEIVRSLVDRVLRALGYTVLSTADFKEAEETFTRHEAEVDLLVTDLIMPGGTGQVLYGKLKQKRPKLKVLYMSGYTQSSSGVDIRQEEGTHFLQKPFSPSAIAAKVREILQGD